MSKKSLIRFDLMFLDNKLFFMNENKHLSRDQFFLISINIFYID